MKRTSLIPMLATFGLCIGAAHAAPPTQSAPGNREPGQSLSAQERKQLSATVKHYTSLVRQPKTQREALATRVNHANGVSEILVPESLWSNLSVQEDARGHMQVREGEGTTLGVTVEEGIPNE